MTLTLNFDAPEQARLNRQEARVWAILADEEWHTLPELASRAECLETSVSARWRGLRAKQPGYRFEKQLVSPGLYRYRAVRR